MKILHLSMGGTIDSAPYSETDYPKDATMTPERLSAAALQALVGDLTSIEICNVDSKYITDAHKQKLFETLISDAHKFDRTIITIGTDRMEFVAREIASRIATPACPVIFTGAILPLSNGAHSDGFQNLKTAANPALKVTAGFYIQMGPTFGDCFYVRKIPDGIDSRFELVQNPITDA